MTSIRTTAAETDTPRQGLTTSATVRQHHCKASRPNNTLGTALIEALVALLILVFGILSLTNMQFGLSREAEISAQRAEAVRLVQDKVEALRQAATLLPLGSVGLASGTDTVATAVPYPYAYTRTWNLNATAASTGQFLTVEVSWPARSGKMLQVTIASRLAPAYARDAYALLQSTLEKDPLVLPTTRSVPISLALIPLGNGESAFKPSGDAPYQVFDDFTGKLVRQCHVAPVNNTAKTPKLATLIASLKDRSQCSEQSGLVLSGTLSRDASIAADEWSAIEPGLGIDTRQITRTPAMAEPIRCYYEIQREQPTATETGDLKAYLCIIPLAPFATASNIGATVTRPSWSGKALVSGTPTNAVTSKSTAVCRYEIGASGNLLDSNQRNLQPYKAVTVSLFLQNYRIFKHTESKVGVQPQCPSGMNHPPTAKGPYDVRGVLHQVCLTTTNMGTSSDLCPDTK